MPSHVFLGIDKYCDLTMSQKHSVVTQCITNLSKGENIISVQYPSYSSLLQCIHPTTKVRLTSIKSMVLTNCQSSSSISILPRILYPFSEDQFLHILFYIVECIELEQARKKTKDDSNWSTWLPELSKSTLNELQQKHFKILPQYIITKKKINRFVNRMNGTIRDQ